ncbi:MAG TPA: alpha/beta fold hydrolase [Blastococcus sp.]|jgi:dienelactone hydrolase
MDERVASAVSNWAPRFTTNGVAVADFQRVTSGIERWDDWCSAWSAAARVHEDLGREALAEGRTRSAGSHLSTAAVYYHFGKFLFVEHPDEAREAHGRAVACLNDALAYLDPAGERIEIPFEGSRMVGVLRRPNGPGPHPVVVMVPGLDSAKEEFRSTEELFLERGLATFSVDGPGQGEAEYGLPIRGDWEVPGRAIVDAVAAQPGIDAERIGVWGVSLGGYYAPRLASGVAEVRACVALSGPYNFGECWDRLPPLTRTAFTVRSFSVDDDAGRRAALQLDMTEAAGRIRVPLLVVAGKQDRLIPWQHAERLVAEAVGPTELLVLDDGNHGNMNVAAKHRFKAADWMAAQLFA